MKQILLPTLVAGFFLSLFSNAQAHRGDRLYPIFELTDADLAQVDLHDGSVAEWEALFGEAALTARDFTASRNFGPYDPADMDFRIWLAWHGAASRIYVAMERSDDIYINEYNPGNIVGSRRFMEESDSSLMFAVDGDHSGGRYRGFSGREDLELILASLDREAQQYVGISETLGEHAQVILHGLTAGLLPPNTPLPNWRNLTHWFNQPPYVEGGGGRFGGQPVLTVTEFYVTPYDLLAWEGPEHSRVSHLSAGKVIGLAIGALDVDEPFDRQGHASIDSWLGLGGGSSSADGMVDGLLLASGEEASAENLIVEEANGEVPVNWDSLKAHYPVRGLNLGSMNGMYTFDEVVAALDSMRLAYPHLISEKQSIGPSFEGRPLWMVKISDHPDLDEPEPEILYTALHHANEPMALMTVLYFMYYLLEQYGADPEVTFLVDNRALYFVPVVNPDGYVYTQQIDADGGGWRRNRNVSDAFPAGVDLNRNYGFQWSESSVSGAAPFSEPETQAIRDFCIRRDFKLALNYHAPFNGLLFPWGYTNRPTADSTAYVELATEMTRFNGLPYGTPGRVLGVGASGTHDDWMYGEQIAKAKILAMTIEVAGERWPHPANMLPRVHEHLHTNLVLARGPGVIEGPTAVADNRSVPGMFGLRPNYPNPFNPSTTITYQLPHISAMRLAVYNLMGQKVRTLVAGTHAAGVYTVQWNGRDDGGRPLAAGIYLYRLEAGSQVETRKLIRVR